jgi:ABC-type lipoprotein release transport system permease subunit
VRVVVGAIGLSIVMWLVVGLLPALRAGRTDLNQTLKGVRAEAWEVGPGVS